MTSAFPGADLSRLTASWNYQPGSINRWLRYELYLLRSRARSLARGDAYAAKFINAAVDNVAGPEPFEMECKIKFSSSGLPNETANDAIETAYERWSQPGNCDVTGKLSLGEMDRLNVRCLARDGEILMRKTVTPQGLQYQLLDIDRLDELFNDQLPDGAIKMGVEVDSFGKPRAYWLLKENPGELGEWNRGRERARERVAAEEVVHVFMPDWPEQVRGFPWLHAAMIRLWHLGAFEEAAIINARVGASKVGVVESPNGDPPDMMASAQVDCANLLENVEPGGYVTLPMGYTLNAFQPTFPDGAIEPFMRSMLRGVAAALGVAYHSLANDPSSVNYSTARVALLEERDMWKSVQNWYIDHVVRPRFADFLRAEIVGGRLPYTYQNAVDDARFQPKTWDWVDPQKEVLAKILALDSQLTSRTRICMESGEDFEDILEELAQEQKIADANGVLLQSQRPGMAQTEPLGPKEAQAEQSEQTPAAGKAIDMLKARMRRAEGD
jgi:lambda family phage portal protein